MPNTSVEECIGISERIVNKCNTTKSSANRVTVSIGFGDIDIANIDDFLSKVDKALYEAKQGGKNQARMVK